MTLVADAKSRVSLARFLKPGQVVEIRETPNGELRVCPTSAEVGSGATCSKLLRRRGRLVISTPGRSIEPEEVRTEMLRQRAHANLL
jgi:hypothetical protein